MKPKMNLVFASAAMIGLVGVMALGPAAKPAANTRIVKTAAAPSTQRSVPDEQTHHAAGIVTVPAPVTTTAPVTSAPKVLVATSHTKPVARHATTKPAAKPTTTTAAPLTFLQEAQSQVGQGGSYTKGGFWCAKFVDWVADQTKVSGWQYDDGPGGLHFLLKQRGLETSGPTVGGLVFVDLGGPGGSGHGQITHVGIVESVDADGTTIHTIEGNADNSGVVIRNVRHVGDGYAIRYASVQ